MELLTVRSFDTDRVVDKSTDGVDDTDTLPETLFESEGVGSKVSEMVTSLEILLVTERERDDDSDDVGLIVTLAVSLGECDMVCDNDSDVESVFWFVGVPVSVCADVAEGLNEMDADKDNDSDGVGTSVSDKVCSAVRLSLTDDDSDLELDKLGDSDSVGSLLGLRDNVSDSVGDVDSVCSLVKEFVAEWSRDGDRVLVDSGDALGVRVKDCETEGSMDDERERELDAEGAIDSDIESDVDNDLEGVTISVRVSVSVSDNDGDRVKLAVSSGVLERDIDSDPENDASGDSVVVSVDDSDRDALLVPVGVSDSL